MIVLQGCPPLPCDPVTSYGDPIPDSILTLIPYINGEVYQLKHSEGKVINFICSNKLIEDKQCFDCSDCFVFERNEVQLNPDYFISPIQLRITGVDDFGFDFHLWFGNSSFNFFIDENYKKNLDSIYIAGFMLNDIVCLKNTNTGFYNSDADLFADSLYYSYDKGIVKLVMTNGEYFELYE